MAPSMTRTPRYTPRRRRRSAGDLLVGLLAIAALVALIVGVPFALVTAFGLPLPHELPSLALLTHQLDLPALLKVLALLVWVAWIQLVWCVIAEIRAAIRNAGIPRRVPLVRRHPGARAPAGQRGPAGLRGHDRTLTRPGASGAGRAALGHGS